MAITAKDLEFVGIEHNDLLDKTYTALKDNNIGKDKSKEFTRNFLVDTIFNMSKYSDKSNTIGAVYASQNVVDPLTVKNLYPNVAGKTLSQKEKDILDELEQILNLSSQEEIDKGSRDLENKISNGKFEDKQLITLYSATNLARYSFKYWSENSRKWSELGDNISAMSTGGDIAIADVAGAVGAAAGAWVVNVLPGPGQIAYGSAIIAGGVGASVAEGVKKLLDWIW